MATRKEIAEKKKEISAQISSLTRTLSLAVLAITWLFLSGDKDAPAVLQSIPRWQAVCIAFLCALALTLDFLQYILAYCQLENDLERAKKREARLKSAGGQAASPKSQERLGDHPYRRSKSRKFMFRAKIVVSAAAAFWLLVLLAFAVIGADRSNGNEESCIQPTVAEPPSVHEVL